MSRRRLAVVAVSSLFALVACATPDPASQAYLRAYRDAETSARPFPPITETRPATTLAEAYRLQIRLAAERRARGDAVAGYRGGLLSLASMAGRKVDAPLAGVLFASGRVDHGGTVSLCGYRRAAMELKLGFVFGQAVRAAPADPAALARAVAKVVPVVDLPDIAYRDPEHYGAVDMVAANISAARYVVGEARAPAGLDLNALTVSLAHESRPVTSGLGRASLDDQWGSLLAVTRQVLASGRTIAPGDLVLTGRMGECAWLPAGTYRADYGPLGTVAFTVRDCA
jgi:2-keto-4-pentenoate hydratase